jgi:hypothetical protein
VGELRNEQGLPTRGQGGSQKEIKGLSVGVKEALGIGRGVEAETVLRRVGGWDYQ